MKCKNCSKKIYNTSKVSLTRVMGETVLKIRSYDNLANLAEDFQISREYARIICRDKKPLKEVYYIERDQERKICYKCGLK